MAPSCLSLGSSPLTPHVFGGSGSLIFPIRSTAETLGSQTSSHQWLEKELLFCFVFRAKEVREGLCLENQADISQDPLLGPLPVQPGTSRESLSGCERV